LIKGGTVLTSIGAFIAQVFENEVTRGAFTHTLIALAQGVIRGDIALDA
jgi:hypothetical protein